MAENYSLLQWNCQGLRAKKDELLQLINIHKPDIIALQETMLGNNPFNISCYSIYNTCGHYNRRPHGGTAILIHNSVPHKQIQLNNDCFQITVVKVALNVPLLIASIYISRSHNIAEPQIKSLLDECRLNYLCLYWETSMHITTYSLPYHKMVSRGTTP